MRDKNTTVINSGTGFSGLLFLVFLVLKLVGVIDWSWWWITAPLWVPTVLFIIIFAVTFIAISLKDALYKKKINRNRGK